MGDRSLFTDEPQDKATFTKDQYGNIASSTGGHRAGFREPKPPAELAKLMKDAIARAGTKGESLINYRWADALSEEVGEDFDYLREHLGDDLASFVMLEWYNSWVKENTIILEGYEHLQEHRILEELDITNPLIEGPFSLKNVAKKQKNSHFWGGE